MGSTNQSLQKLYYKHVVFLGTPYQKSSGQLPAKRVQLEGISTKLSEWNQRPNHHHQPTISFSIIKHATLKRVYQYVYEERRLCPTYSKRLIAPLLTVSLSRCYPA